jgi:hypothetical protein
VASIVKPDTILAWHRKLIAQKFDESQHRQSPVDTYNLFLSRRPDQG